MTRVSIGVIVALLVALVISGLILKREVARVGALEASYKTSQEDIGKLNKELLRRDEVDKATDQVVTKTVETNVGVEKAISDIQQVVKSTSKKEMRGEITPTTASSVYINSMWRAYCQANIPNPRCSTR